MKDARKLTGVSATKAAVDLQPQTTPSESAMFELSTERPPPCYVAIVLPPKAVVALHVLRNALPHGNAPGPEGELRAMAVEELKAYLKG